MYRVFSLGILGAGNYFSSSLEKPVWLVFWFTKLNTIPSLHNFLLDLFL